MTVSDLAPHAVASGVFLAPEPLNPMVGGKRTRLFPVAGALAVCGRGKHRTSVVRSKSITSGRTGC